MLDGPVQSPFLEQKFGRLCRGSGWPASLLVAVLRFVGLVRERNRDSGSCFDGHFCGLSIGPRFLPQSSAPKVRGRQLEHFRSFARRRNSTNVSAIRTVQARQRAHECDKHTAKCDSRVRRNVHPRVHKARDAANPSRTSRAISLPNARKRHPSISETRRHISKDDQLMCPPCIRTPGATQSAFCYVRLS